MGIQPRAGGGAAEGDLGHAAEGVAHASVPEPHLGGIPGELLPERHWHGVHHVRAAGLHHVRELARLGLEGGGQRVERGQQLSVVSRGRGQVHGRGEDVVGGLPHVHVVVGVHALAGQVGDHLVGVHVGGGAGAGLEHVDGELVVVLAARHLVGGCGRALCQVGVEQSQLCVRAGRCRLDVSQHPHDGRRHPLARHREVVHRLARLRAPELLLHRHRSPRHRRLALRRLLRASPSGLRQKYRR